MSTILLGKGQSQAFILNKVLNRHGIIAGATGTGKTITLKVLAEQLSLQGIPVFLSDVKGDLGSMIKPGVYSETIEQRVKTIGIDNYDFQGFPVEFYDIFKEEGTTIRCTISQMGPIMLTRLLGLNETQSGILSIVFQVADDNGWQLDDLKDLRALLNYVQQNSASFSKQYGNISSASIAAIMRALLVIEQQGGNFFFGEPAFDVNDLLSTRDNLGVINILNSKKLLLSPQLYSTFLFWLLSELFETLPEVGDVEKPKLVFFFDEAHVLFNNDNKVLLEKIELLVRLIRSKGVGIFFITQNPQDIPDSISSQLATRIQHGMRAFSPKELKNIKSIAETFRNDYSLNVEQLITNLAVGEAIYTTLDVNGVPTNVEKILITPPRSLIGLITSNDILHATNHSPLFEKYFEESDDFSAFEAISKLENTQIQQSVSSSESTSGITNMLSGIFGNNRKTDSMADRLTKNIMSSIGREVGRQIVRGIFGTKR